jgi:hypothetical protein
LNGGCREWAFSLKETISRSRDLSRQQQDAIQHDYICAISSHTCY